MKKRIFLQLIFLLSCFIFAQESRLNDERTIKVDLQVGDEDLFIEFIDSHTYTFYSPFGGHMWDTYSYTLENNILTLYNDNNHVFSVDRLNSLIFPDGKKGIFVRDEEFKDFYCKGVYKNDTLILRDFLIPTPAGEECILNGIQVIKYDRQTSQLIAKENLRIRKAPNLSAETGKFNYTSYFCPYYDPYNGRNFSLPNSDTVYSVTENQYLSILISGLVVSFDAVTIKKDTIDGITAPWYRICMYDNSDEGTTQFFWIFGGYIQEITDYNNPEYLNKMIQSALEKGILKR